MSFDKKFYKEVKKYMDDQLSRVDFRLVEKYKDKPFEYAQTFLPMISNSIEHEDFESSKAITDAIRDFLNKFLSEENKISKSAEINLPEYKQMKIKGIICFVDDELRSSAITINKDI